MCVINLCQFVKMSLLIIYCYSFMHSSVLCIVTYGAIKLNINAVQINFMRLALDLHNLHKISYINLLLYGTCRSTEGCGQ